MAVAALPLCAPAMKLVSSTNVIWPLPASAGWAWHCPGVETPATVPAPVAVMHPSPPAGCTRLPSAPRWKIASPGKVSLPATIVCPSGLMAL